VSWFVIHANSVAYRIMVLEKEHVQGDNRFQFISPVK
jgi:hypothetical protein